MTSNVTDDSIFECPACQASLRYGDMIKVVGAAVPILIRYTGLGMTDPTWVCRDCAELAGLVTLPRARRRP